MMKSKKSVNAGLIRMACLLFAAILAANIALAESGNSSSGNVIIAGLYNNPPKIFIDEKGDASGVLIDILESIAEKEGWRLEYRACIWEECLNMLQRNELDIMPDVSFSDERAVIFDFTKETVLTNWGAVYIGEGSEISSILDLEGKKVAVMNGSTHTVSKEGIISLARRFGMQCEFIETNDYFGVFGLVKEGKADAGVANRIFGLMHMREYGLIQSPIIFNPSEIRYAFPKNSSSGARIAERIDYYLVQMKDNPDSAYYKSIEEYIAPVIEEKIIEKVPFWAFATLGVAAAAVLLVLGLNYILKSQVALKTSELKKSNNILRNEISRRKRSEASAKKRAEMLERFAKLAAGREERMIELKGMINKAKSREKI